MASEVSSAEGHRKDTERDKNQSQGSNAIAARTTEDLTHELAQLLAATIAQRQLANALPASAQANLNLANLTPSQRTLEPAYKDGLSSLSYKPPRGAGLLPAPEFPPDDEPMPIPSTWREPPAQEGDRWLRQQMGATILGLCAGLLVVVPVVMWLSGWLGTAQKSRPGRTAEAAIAPIEPRPSEVKTVKVQVRPVETAAQYVTGSVDGRIAMEPPRPAEPPRAEPPRVEPVAQPAPARDPADERLAEAKQRIENGDILGAREILAAAERMTPGGAVSFALAETYDPNMLAAWGTRGAAADVARAKALYHKSLDQGIARAQMRLEALQ